MRSCRRSSRFRSSDGLRAVVAAATLVVSCTHFGGAPRESLTANRACSVVDSVLAHSGLRSQIELRGKATIDVNQYRVRGRFEMGLTPDGDLTFSITSTTLIGGHREDAVLSFYADTLRALDRERGRFYQGAEVDALVADGTGVELDLGRLLRYATARTPECGRLDEVRRAGGAGERLDVDGFLDGRRFEVRIENGRITRSVWPLPLVAGWREERVEITYTWAGERLTGVTIRVPERRWRVRLQQG